MHAFVLFVRFLKIVLYAQRRNLAWRKFRRVMCRLFAGVAEAGNRLEWRRREQTNWSTVMCSRAKNIVSLNLHVCMPFSAHFYVLLTQFTLSLYFTVV